MPLIACSRKWNLPTLCRIGNHHDICPCTKRWWFCLARLGAESVEKRAAASATKLVARLLELSNHNANTREQL